MKILHLDSSINYEFSVTRQLSAETVKATDGNQSGNHQLYRSCKDEISHLTGKSLQNWACYRTTRNYNASGLSENYQMLWSLSFLKAT